MSSICINSPQCTCSVCRDVQYGEFRVALDFALQHLKDEEAFQNDQDREGQLVAQGIAQAFGEIEEVIKRFPL